MSTRDVWLDEGLAVLAAEGEPGVRTDRLASRLGLTKGSFHHHFAGAADFRAQLLARYEARSTQVLHEVAEDVAGLEPMAALARLRDEAGDLFDADLERAVRAWAFHDADARAVQTRVDGARLAALEAIWRRALGDVPAARIAALLPHLVVIGASVALPPTPNADLEAVFELLVRLAPEVGVGDR